MHSNKQASPPAAPAIPVRPDYRKLALELGRRHTQDILDRRDKRAQEKPEAVN